MMKSIAIILCLFTLCALFGCTENTKLLTPVTFYYCFSDIDHQGEREVFGKEEREGNRFAEDIVGLLNEYFRGPNNEKLYNPFPAGSKVIDAKQEGNVLTLYLSEHFDRLQQEKLTLALSCLVQTVFEHTSVPVLLIIPIGTFIDGTNYKTFTPDSFIYSDKDTSYTPPQ